MLSLSANTEMKSLLELFNIPSSKIASGWKCSWLHHHCCLSAKEELFLWEVMLLSISGANLLKQVAVHLPFAVGSEVLFYLWARWSWYGDREKLCLGFVSTCLKHDRNGRKASKAVAALIPYSKMRVVSGCAAWKSNTLSELKAIRGRRKNKYSEGLTMTALQSVCGEQSRRRLLDTCALGMKWGRLEFNFGNWYHIRVIYSNVLHRFEKDISSTEGGKYDFWKGWRINILMMS